MTMTGKAVIGGAAIHLTLYAVIPDVGEYFEEDFIAWDAQLKEVTLFAVSNHGEVGKYSGQWVSGEEKTLKLGEIRVVRDIEVKADLTISFPDENTIVWNADILRRNKTASFKSKFTKK